MCLHPLAVYMIPEETERVAKLAFPKGNLYLRLFDEIGPFYSDPQFADLFPARGQPAWFPGRLALVLVLQCLEKLTDRQAADAVRSRLDWKYLLGLQLTDPGFDFSLLSEFRQRLVTKKRTQLLLDLLLDRLQDRGLLRARGRQRTDSTHILARVRTLNRLELVGRTLQHALNALARAAPGWLRARVPDAWFARYGRLIEEYRLPQQAAERRALAATIGADGLYLLAQLAQSDAPATLRELPALQILRQVWAQQYSVVAGQAHWREMTEVPPAAERIASPHDPAARYSTKRSVTWVGYKVHLTETCEEDLPHLITHVETCPATEDDGVAVAHIHAGLAQSALLPGEHVVDTAYPSGENLVRSREDYQVELLGPVRPDVSWQAQDEQAFDITCFKLDWDAQQATCPQGRVSWQWHDGHGPSGKPTVQIQFNPADCQPCAVRARCTRRKTGARELTVHRQAEHEALQAARQRQQTPEFKQAYACRAGIEGTISAATVAHAMRRSRYIGPEKTHLQHVLTAVAIDVQRVVAWLQKEPRAQTRRSPFAALAPV